MIGACDMPILDADIAHQVYVIKRGKGKGYAGIGIISSTTTIATWFTPMSMRFVSR
jgi:hypothetical protein